MYYPYVCYKIISSSQTDYTAAENDCETQANSKLMMIKTANDLQTAQYVYAATSSKFWLGSTTGAGTSSMTWLDLSGIDLTYYCASISSTAATNALYFASTCLDIVDISTNLIYVCQYNS